MENSTNGEQYRWEYEYYYDYLDAVIVNESTLKYNKCKYLSFIQIAKLLFFVTANCIIYPFNKLHLGYISLLIYPRYILGISNSLDYKVITFYVSILKRLWLLYS